MQLKKRFAFPVILALLIVGVTPYQAVCEEESEDSLDLSNLPDAVRTAIGEHSKGVMPTEIEREESDGFVYYEAEFKEGEVTHEIKMDEMGRIVEIEEEMPSSHLPAGAMNQLKKSYSGYEIEEVELKTVIHYEIEIEVDEKEIKLMILENGASLGATAEEEEEEDGEEEEESEIAWADLPAPVQEAITTHRPDLKPEGFEKEKMKDATFYEAEYPEVEGVKHEIQLDELGNIIEVEDEMPVSNLPDSIRKHVESTYPNGSIEEVALKRSTFYAIELEKGDEEIEIRILATGHLLGVGDSD